MASLDLTSAFIQQIVNLSKALVEMQRDKELLQSQVSQLKEQNCELTALYLQTQLSTPLQQPATQPTPPQPLATTVSLQPPAQEQPQGLSKFKFSSLLAELSFLSDKRVESYIP